MIGYVDNIEAKTLANSFFREVLFTGKYAQLVVMSLLPNEEIGMEVHQTVDQFFRIEKGQGKVIMNGEEHEIDSRTSDAIALALRFGAPIYIYEDILDQSGILLVEEETKEDIFEDDVEVALSDIKSQKEKTDYNIYTNKELEKLMNDALHDEDYEKAAKIRDELNKRK